MRDQVHKTTLETLSPFILWANWIQNATFFLNNKNKKLRYEDIYFYEKTSNLKCHTGNLHLSIYFFSLLFFIVNNMPDSFYFQYSIFNIILI